MRAALIFLSFTFFISCKPEVNINLNPLGSNLQLNREAIEKLGFQFYSGDHELCMYQKQFDTLRMYFLFNSDDECNAMKMQGIEFPFDKFKFNSSEDSSKLIYGEYSMDIFNDSLKISAIIHKFGGQIVSNKKGYKDLRNNYDIKNMLTGQVLSVSVHYKIDSKKYLNIEVE